MPEARFRKWVRAKLHGMGADLKQISKDTSEILSILMDSEPNGELKEPTDRDSLDKALIAWDPIRAIATVPELKLPARDFRDWLAGQFEYIGLVNYQANRHNYTATHNKHSDAFVVMGKTGADDIVIDFCLRSSGPGVLREHLQWIVVPPPW